MQDNKKNSPSELDDFVSKTQLKNEAKALHAFGKELIELPDYKLEALPLLNSTKRAVREFHKQHGNIAKKRHLAYIGKCLRNDDAEAAQQMLTDEAFQQMRAKAKPEVVTRDRVQELVEGGDQSIQQMLEEYPSLDRQNMRQLVRNINNAKAQSKLDAAKTKLAAYLKSHQVE